MTLNNLQIKIKDFKSISQTDWILLDGKIEVLGKNLIDGGSNGSGKSSILEALYTSVALCELKDNTSSQKELKKYYRDNKHPFEVLIKFNVKGNEYEIKATPDGIKEGSIEAKQHLYMLVTSFLMQGMTNSLIKQEASECKAVISSYFECDRIIDNIVQNSAIIKDKLNDKLNELSKSQEESDKIIEISDRFIETSQFRIQQLENEKQEIQKKIGTEDISYNENQHNVLLSEIKKLDNEIKVLDDEIGSLYNEKSALSSGIEVRIKELKELRDKIIEDSKGLYIRTAGNKFGAYVKKALKEYNELQKQQYEIDEKASKEEKAKKIAEITEKIKKLDKKDSSNSFISKGQKDSILITNSNYIEKISKKVRIVTVEEETKNHCSDVLSIVKTEEAESKQKLEKELSGIKKSAVKKFKEVKIVVYTSKNKPKRNLPDYYIVYNCDTETNQKTIIENTAKMIDENCLNNALQDIELYVAPETTDIEQKIKDLENTDIAIKIIEINNNISVKQSDKYKKSIQLKNLIEQEDKLKENKIKSELYANDKKRLLLIKSDISKLKNEVEESEKSKKNHTKKLSETVKQINRWSLFLDEVNKDTRLVQNSFKDYIIDLYNTRLEPLINFYSNKVYNLNSKLIVKIGSKIKQPTLNGIKFDYTSGGEKSKALFIFSLAHRDYLSKQRGFNNDYIFCDEVFDGMDEISRQLSINFLTQALVMQNVLVISHMEDKSFPAFKRLTVIKSENGTDIKL